MVALPRFSLGLAPPGRMSAPMIVGGAIESRSASGYISATDISGGGFVAIKYSNIVLGNRTPDAVRYWSMLGAQLSGGQRSIIVPFLTDFWANSGNPIRSSGIPHSDGSFFSDGSGYSQTNIPATLAAAAAVNANPVTINIQTGQLLYGGEWFSISHSDGYPRSYVVTDIVSQVVNSDGSTTSVVAIRPPLRRATTINTPVKFDRPECTMKLKGGTYPTMDFSNYWWSTPEIDFIESFP